MAYTDELEPMLSLEHDLRIRIALRIAQEGQEPGDEEPRTGAPSEDQLSAADAAIAAWSEQHEAEHDMRAFRPLTPLQQLLADHDAIMERILDLRDRRLS